MAVSHTTTLAKGVEQGMKWAVTGRLVDRRPTHVITTPQGWELNAVKLEDECEEGFQPFHFTDTSRLVEIAKERTYSVEKDYDRGFDVFDGRFQRPVSVQSADHFPDHATYVDVVDDHGQFERRYEQGDTEQPGVVVTGRYPFFGCHAQERIDETTEKIDY